jgi:hypothetical protein
MDLLEELNIRPEGFTDLINFLLYQDENVIVVDSKNNVFGIHYKRIFLTEVLKVCNHIECFKFDFSEFEEALDKNLIKFVQRENGNFFKANKKLRKIVHQIQFTEEMLEEWLEDSVIAEEAYYVQKKYLNSEDLNGFIKDFTKKGGTNIIASTIFELNTVGQYIHNCKLSLRKFFYRLEKLVADGIPVIKKDLDNVEKNF